MKHFPGRVPERKNFFHFHWENDDYCVAFLIGKSFVIAPDHQSLHHQANHSELVFFPEAFHQILADGQKGAADLSMVDNWISFSEAYGTTKIKPNQSNLLAQESGIINFGPNDASRRFLASASEQLLFFFTVNDVAVTCCGFKVVVDLN